MQLSQWASRLWPSGESRLVSLDGSGPAFCASTCRAVTHSEPVLTGAVAVWVAQAVTTREGGVLVSMTELVPPAGAPFALDRSSVTLTILAAGGAVEVRGCPAP